MASSPSDPGSDVHAQTQEEDVSDFAAFFSTEGGTRPARHGRWPPPATVARANFAKDVADRIKELRAKWPHECNSIFGPWDIRWYWDEYDFQVQGGKFLWTVINTMMEENQANVETFTRRWTTAHAAQYRGFMELIPSEAGTVQRIFHENDIATHGVVFLEEVLRLMRSSIPIALKWERERAAASNTYGTIVPSQSEFQSHPLIPQMTEGSNSRVLSRGGPYQHGDHGNGHSRSYGETSMLNALLSPNLPPLTVAHNRYDGHGGSFMVNQARVVHLQGGMSASLQQPQTFIQHGNYGPSFAMGPSLHNEFIPAGLRQVPLHVTDPYLPSSVIPSHQGPGYGFAHPHAAPFIPSNQFLQGDPSSTPLTRDRAIVGHDRRTSIHHNSSGSRPVDRGHSRDVWEDSDQPRRPKSNSIKRWKDSGSRGGRGGASGFHGTMSGASLSQNNAVDRSSQMTEDRRPQKKGHDTWRKNENVRAPKEQKFDTAVPSSSSAANISVQGQASRRTFDGNLTDGSGSLVEQGSGEVAATDQVSVKVKDVEPNPHPHIDRVAEFTPSNLHSNKFAYPEVDYVDINKQVGPSFIGKDVEDVMSLYVSGFTSGTSAEDLLQTFGQLAGFSEVEGPYQRLREGPHFRKEVPFAFIHFNTTADAREGLKAAGSYCNGTRVQVQVPTRLQTPNAKIPQVFMLNPEEKQAHDSHTKAASAVVKETVDSGASNLHEEASTAPAYSKKKGIPDIKEFESLAHRTDGASGSGQVQSIAATPEAVIANEREKNSTGPSPAEMLDTAGERNVVAGTMDAKQSSIEHTQIQQLKAAPTLSNESTANALNADDSRVGHIDNSPTEILNNSSETRATKQVNEEPLTSSGAKIDLSAGDVMIPNDDKGSEGLELDQQPVGSVEHHDTTNTDQAKQNTKVQSIQGSTKPQKLQIPTSKAKADDNDKSAKQAEHVRSTTGSPTNELKSSTGKGAQVDLSAHGAQMRIKNSEATSLDSGSAGTMSPTKRSTKSGGTQGGLVVSSSPSKAKAKKNRKFQKAPLAAMTKEPTDAISGEIAAGASTTMHEEQQLKQSSSSASDAPPHSPTAIEETLIPSEGKQLAAESVEQAQVGSTSTPCQTHLSVDTPTESGDPADGSMASIPTSISETITPDNLLANLGLKDWHHNYEQVVAFILRLPEAERPGLLSEADAIKLKVEDAEKRLSTGAQKLATGSKSVKKKQRAQLNTLTKSYNDLLVEFQMCLSRAENREAQIAPAKKRAYPAFHQEAAKYTFKDDGEIGETAERKWQTFGAAKQDYIEKKQLYDDGWQDIAPSNEDDEPGDDQSVESETIGDLLEGAFEQGSDLEGGRSIDIAPNEDDSLGISEKRTIRLKNVGTGSDKKIVISYRQYDDPEHHQQTPTEQGQPSSEKDDVPPTPTTSTSTVGSADQNTAAAEAEEHEAHIQSAPTEHENDEDNSRNLGLDVSNGPDMPQSSIYDVHTADISSTQQAKQGGSKQDEPDKSSQVDTGTSIKSSPGLMSYAKAAATGAASTAPRTPFPAAQDSPTLEGNAATGSAHPAPVAKIQSSVPHSRGSSSVRSGGDKKDPDDEDDWKPGPEGVWGSEGFAKKKGG